MTRPRIGELCAGYGGLGMGVQSVLGGELAWVSEYEPPSKANPKPSQGAAKILAHRFPGVPNHGDMTKIDWAAVEPVDILTGGTPCQDLSAAGKRAGMRAGTRSGLWASMCDAIEIIRPGLVVWENVRGALSAHADSAVEPCPICVGDERDAHLRALGRVVGDLSELGYVGRWVGLRAADVGAPHGRFRVFVAAWPAADADDREPHQRTGTDGATDQRTAAGWAQLRTRGHRGGATPDPADDGRERRRPSRHGRDGSADHGHAAADTEGQRRGEGRAEPAGIVGGSDDVVGGASVAADADVHGCERVGRELAGERDADGRSGADTAWGNYEPAIRRWEGVLGRPAPAPTEVGAKGNARLSPRFVEFLMGVPAGWVTDVPGLSRNEQLKALGNGVVPQQAAQALRMLLPHATRAAA